MILAVVVSAASACSDPGTIDVDVTLPSLDSADLAGATVSAGDVGEDWEEQQGATPSTVQIGGKVGPANIPNPVAQATSAFEKKEGDGVVSNTVYLLGSEEVAAAVMDAHTKATDRSWTQRRSDGGSYAFERTGTVEGLSKIGDEVYTARLDVTITTGPPRIESSPGTGEDADETPEPAKQTIEFVAYRTGAMVSFLVAEGVGVAGFARDQADRLHDIVARAPVATPR